MVRDRYEWLLRALLASIEGPSGTLDAQTRKDLVAGKPLAGVLGSFATKVTENPGSINDDTVDTLVAKGVSEESIFDCVVAASIGAGLVRLRAAMRALGEKS
jgi:hypothetical protein